MKIYNTRNELFNSFEKNLKIIEIGVFKGEFSKFIFENLNPKELHLIDIFEGSTCSGDKDGNNIIYTDLDEEYRNICKWSSMYNNIYVHKGRSVEILKSFNDNYFDLIYIDGDHSYSGVYSDLNLSFPKLALGGYLAGHDYTQRMFPGVVKAVDEFVQNHNLRIEYLTKDGCPSYVIIKI